MRIYDRIINYIKTQGYLANYITIHYFRTYVNFLIVLINLIINNNNV